MCISSDAISAYEWLVCYLLHESDNKLKEELKSGKDNFTARNDSQVYYCRTLSIAYIEVSHKFMSKLQRSLSGFPLFCN